MICVVVRVLRVLCALLCVGALLCDHVDDMFVVVLMCVLVFLYVRVCCCCAVYVAFW